MFYDRSRFDPRRPPPPGGNPMRYLQRNLYITIALLAVVATVKFLVPNVADHSGATFRVGPEAQYAQGSVTLVSSGVAYLVHDARGFYALSAQPRPGCSDLIHFSYASQRFSDPCSGSLYDLQGLPLTPSGQLDANGEPLRHYLVLRNSDGVLLIDELKVEPFGWRLAA
jgi:hypothetical protein